MTAVATRNGSEAARPRRSTSAAKSVVVLCLVVLAMMGPSYASVFLVGIATTAAVYVLLGYSVATSLWYTGGLNFGVGAIAMVAAYVVVIGSEHGWAIWQTELVAIIGSGVVNVALAPFYFRLRGIYFAIMTFAVASLAGELAGTVKITGGTEGLPFLPRNGPIPGVSSGINQTYYVTVAAMIAIGLLLKFLRGRACGVRGMALANDEVLCQSLGVDRRVFQGAASLAAGAIAGLAGTCFVFELGYVSPDEFSLSLSLAALVALIIGGEQYVVAPIIGCFFAVFLPDLLSVSAFWNQVIYAGALIIVVLLIPGGLLSLVTRGGRLRGVMARSGPLVDARHMPAFAKRLVLPLTARPALGDLTTLSVEGNGVVGIADLDVKRPTSIGSPSVGRDVGRGVGRVGAPGRDGAGTRAGTLTVGAQTGRGRGAKVGRAVDPVKSGSDAPGHELRAEGIVVRYGGVVAVNDVSCVIRPGEVIGLLGPNGSGKTTLVNALSGLVRREGGTITLDGQLVDNCDVTALARRGLRRTFQGPRSFKWLTVEEHLAAVQPGASWNEGDARDRILSEIVGRFGLRSVLSEFPASLPYGMQRLLGLTMAIAGLPKYLLLDEPTSGLHESERLLIEEVIEQLSVIGIGTLVIDHNMQFLTSIAPTSFAMHSGSVIAAGETGDVLASPDVRRVYIGE